MSFHKRKISLSVMGGVFSRKDSMPLNFGIVETQDGPRKIYRSWWDGLLYMKGGRLLKSRKHVKKNRYSRKLIKR